MIYVVFKRHGGVCCEESASVDTLQMLAKRFFWNVTTTIFALQQLLLLAKLNLLFRKLLRAHRYTAFLLQNKWPQTQNIFGFLPPNYEQKDS